MVNCAANMATVTRKRRSSAFMEAEPRTKKGDTDSEPVTPETPVAGRKHVDAKVEHAKSGRSTCRVCNSAIQQGDVRIGRAFLCRGLALALGM